MEVFFGKYRGTVENNIDPKKQGRLQVKVPSVYGDNKLSWAMPCVPYAGADVGLVLLPANGTDIWVEFEGGNIDYPIWSGCFWKEGQLPSEVLTAEVKLLKTKGITLKLVDTPGSGGITLEAKSPVTSQTLSLKFDSKGIVLTNSVATISLSESGMELKRGSQSIEISSTSVSVNNGTMEIN